MIFKNNKDVGFRPALKIAIIGFVAMVVSIVAFIMSIDSIWAIILDLFLVWPFCLLSLAPAIKSVKLANFEAKEGREKPKSTFICGWIGVLCIVVALLLLIINMVRGCN
ncbi:MAG: hypothetical protein E7382_02665 [Clostridiales bacterium]|nr:hypothetical protein [Clostridiales bacterium]